jgi:DNA-binding ferritin-like protein
VNGLNFFQLRRLFDEIHAEIEEFVDTVAERVMALRRLLTGRPRSLKRTAR